MKINRSPTIAMLWSLCIPGFGQFYNRDYIIGLVLVTLELMINVKAHLNLAILYSFRGQISLAIQTVDYQWLLFYPCIYSYSMWQAYNQALETSRFDGENEKDHPKLRYNGHFIGAAMGGTLGIIYSDQIGPVFGGFLGLAIGVAIGSWLKRL